VENFWFIMKEICDARYYKCCGGQTDVFSTAWEDQNYDYLSNVSDGIDPHSPVRSESDAERWLTGNPGAYCNTMDKELLKNILPAFDQETPDFYRWQEIYERPKLEEVIRKNQELISVFCEISSLCNGARPAEFHD